jgi:hypothetical protein
MTNALSIGKNARDQRWSSFVRITSAMVGHLEIGRIAEARGQVDTPMGGLPVIRQQSEDNPEALLRLFALPIASENRYNPLITANTNPDERSPIVIGIVSRSVMLSAILGSRTISMDTTKLTPMT